MSATSATLFLPAPRYRLPACDVKGRRGEGEAAAEIERERDVIIHLQCGLAGSSLSASQESNQYVMAERWKETCLGAARTCKRGGLAPCSMLSVPGAAVV